MTNDVLFHQNKKPPPNPTAKASKIDPREHPINEKYVWEDRLVSPITYLLNNSDNLAVNSSTILVACSFFLVILPKKTGFE